MVTAGDHLVGTITEREVLRKGAKWSACPLRSARSDRDDPTIMTPDPETRQRHDSIALAMTKMHVGGFRQIPIIDDDRRPLHVISIRDLIGYVLDYFPERILNIPTEPYRGERRRESE